MSVARPRLSLRCFRLGRSPERLAQGFVVLVCVSILGLSLWRVMLARDQAIADSWVDGNNLARSVADHAHSTLKAADIMTVVLVERLESGGTSPSALQALQRTMAARIDTLSTVRDIRVFSATGVSIINGRANEEAPGNVSERDFFRHHRDNATASVFVGPPMQGRTSEHWWIGVSRRFNDSQGMFAGVVLVTIDTDVFAKYYASFDIGIHGFIALIHADSTLIVRAPSTRGVTGTSMQGAPAFKLYAAGARSGRAEGVSKFDDITRLATFRAVETYPVAVFVTLALTDALEHWRNDAWATLSAATVIAATLSGIGLRLAGQIRLRHRAELAVRSSETQLRLLAENGTDVIIQLDETLRRVFVSPTCQAMLGYRPDEMLGLSPNEFAHPEDRHALNERLTHPTGDGFLVPFTSRVRRKDGSYVWVEAIGRKIAGGGVVLSLRDVSERRAVEIKLHEANDQLQRMAMLDGMTGIANRRCLDLTLEREYRRAARTETPIAALLIDVDRFKMFNDSYGHLVGDECLRKVAGAIATLAQRQGDFAARYGGEEFAVLLPDTDLAGAQSIAERICQGIRDLQIPHDQMPDGAVTVSIGVAVEWPVFAGERTTQTLLTLADEALYRAKTEGRNRVCLAAVPKVLVTAEEMSFRRA